MQIDILKCVDDQLIEAAKCNDRDYTHFHPSEWGKCHRKITYEYYEAKGYIALEESSIKISPQLERIFGNGNYVHERWGGYLEKTGALMGVWECQHKIAHSSHDSHSGVYGRKEKLGVLKPQKCACGHKEFKYAEIGLFDEETWWGGHVDAIIDVSLWPIKPILKNGQKDHRWNKYLVVDYKSINPFDFKKITAPTTEHNIQMQIYLYLADLKYGKFIYENKAFQDVKEFLVVRDDDLLAVKIEEAKFLKYIVNNTRDGSRCLPRKAYSSRGHKDCLYCKYRGNCWKQ